ALDGARTRMSRKPSALARELLRNFPKGRGRRSRGRRRGKGGDEATKSAQGRRKAQAASDGPPEDVLDEALTAEAEGDDVPLEDDEREELDEAVDDVLEELEDDDSSEAA
nr:hypothetical protein [Actinomycetota bacterium]